MQKLHMFLSFPGSSFFPGCVLLSAKQTDHPFRGPSCPKTGWERTNTQENSQVWSIVFGVILSSLGLVNANCGFPLHEMVTWRWNTRMIVGKHGKLTVSGTILSTVQVRMLGHSLWTQAQWQTSIKTDRTKLSAVPLWIPNMSSWCTSWCPFGKDQSKKKSMARYPFMMDLDRSRQWRRHDTSDLSRDPMGSSSWSNLIFQHLVQLHQATNPAPAIQWLGRLAAPSVPNAAARDFFWESHRRNGMQSELSIGCNTW